MSDLWKKWFDDVPTKGAGTVGIPAKLQDPFFPPQPGDTMYGIPALYMDLADTSGEWMGQPRTVPSYGDLLDFVPRFDAPAPVTGLLWTPKPRRLPGELYRCSCAWVFPDLFIWVPWCEIHGDPEYGRDVEPWADNFFTWPSEMTFHGVELEAEPFHPFKWAYTLETIERFTRRVPLEMPGLELETIYTAPPFAFELVRQDMEQATRDMQTLLWQLGDEVWEASRAQLKLAGIRYAEPRFIGWITSEDLLRVDGESE